MNVKKCARHKNWPYPYWCTRNLFHGSSCALKPRWFYWFLER